MCLTGAILVSCMLLFSPQRLCETFLILSRIHRHLIGIVCWSAVQWALVCLYLTAVQWALVCLLMSWWNLIVSTYFRKIPKNRTSWKSVQWEPTSFMWTDGRTDMANLIVAFRNSANTHTKGTLQRTDCTCLLLKLLPFPFYMTTNWRDRIIIWCCW